MSQESKGIHTKWTLEMVDYLQDCWGMGFTATEISEGLNATYKTRLTRNAVLGKLHRIKHKGEER